MYLSVDICTWKRKAAKGLGSRRGEIGPAIEMHTDLKYVYYGLFHCETSKFYLPSA